MMAQRNLVLSATMALASLLVIIIFLTAGRVTKFEQQLFFCLHVWSHQYRRASVGADSVEISQLGRNFLRFVMINGSTRYQITAAVE
jgi:hypothetical protein